MLGELPKTIVVATRNPGKMREIEACLSGLPVELVPLVQVAPGLRVPEEGETFADNAREKAQATAAATGEYAMADDSGLEVEALGGLPGVRSSRFAGPGATDEERIAELLALMRGVPPDRRQSRFVCVVALASPEGEVWTWEGTCEGEIAQAPRGTGGFGYDPVFLVPELGKTMAELPPEEKNALSHRGRALRRMREALEGCATSGAAECDETCLPGI